MNDICFRKLFEQNRFILDDSFRTRLILLCCNVCKKLESEEKLDKYEELFVIPIFVSQRRTEEPLMRMMGCGALENIAKEFDNADDESVENFLKNLQEVAKSKGQYSHKWLDNISEGTYCKIAARLYWMQCYDLLFMIAMQYIANMTAISGSNVRTNWYYKRNGEKPFFQIGIALDEGIVQTLTMEMLHSDEFKELTKAKDRTESLASLSDAYFFEMKFVEKLIDTFKLERKKFLSSSFSENCLDFLVEETKKVDYCDLYKLLSLSDQQRWKEVNAILKKYVR